jgi:hypothetical protein
MPIAQIVAAGRHLLQPVVAIDMHRNDGLAQVALAGHAFALLLGGAEHRQQEGGQDGDDGNDHQQFDEGKRRLSRAGQFAIQ